MKTDPFYEQFLTSINITATFQLFLEIIQNRMRSKPLCSPNSTNSWMKKKN